MFRLRHDALRLDSSDLSSGDLAGEKRVFSEGVVAASGGEVAVDIHEWLKRDADAMGARFAPDEFSIRLGIGRAEGCGKAHGSRGCDGWDAGKDPGWAIRESDRRNSEAGNSGEIACLPLICGGILGGAMKDGQLFIESHPRKKALDPGFTGSVRFLCESWRDASDDACQDEDNSLIRHIAFA